jgi:four helix bundle protein
MRESNATTRTTRTTEQMGPESPSSDRFRVRPFPDLEPNRRQAHERADRHMVRRLPDRGAMIGDELKARTRRFALGVIDLCLKLGSDDLAKLVRPQLLRAGTGVAANHRASTRCRSSREFASKLLIVVEEADESEFWLDVLETRRAGAPSSGFGASLRSARHLCSVPPHRTRTYEAA